MAAVLLVDDEPNVRRALRAVLEHSGFTVIEAENGAEALRKFRQQPVRVVVTDIFMPEMDGLETIRMLRELEPDVRIIAISGGGSRVDPGLLQAAKHMGSTRVLTKPLVPSELVRTVHELAQE